MSTKSGFEIALVVFALTIGASCSDSGGDTEPAGGSAGMTGAAGTSGPKSCLGKGKSCSNDSDCCDLPPSTSGNFLTCCLARGKVCGDAPGSYACSGEDNPPNPSGTGGAGPDRCASCLDSCRGLSQCCTGAGCLCESEC